MFWAGSFCASRLYARKSGPASAGRRTQRGDLCRNCSKTTSPAIASSVRSARRCLTVARSDGRPPPLGGAVQAALRHYGQCGARPAGAGASGWQRRLSPAVGVNLLGRGSGPLFDADSYLSPVHVRIGSRAAAAKGCSPSATPAASTACFSDRRREPL